MEVLLVASRYDSVRTIPTPRYLSTGVESENGSALEAVAASSTNPIHPPPPFDQTTIEIHPSTRRDSRNSNIHHIISSTSYHPHHTQSSDTPSAPLFLLAPPHEPSTPRPTAPYLTPTSHDQPHKPRLKFINLASATSFQTLHIHTFFCEYATPIETFLNPTVCHQSRQMYRGPIPHRASLSRVAIHRPGLPPSNPLCTGYRIALPSTNYSFHSTKAYYRPR